MKKFFWVVLGLAFVCLWSGVSSAKEASADMPTMPVASPEMAKPVVKSVGTDTNKDGKPDRWENYQDGKLIKIEADTNGDGKIDETGFVENSKLVRVEKDSDYDGKVDKWVTY